MADGAHRVARRRLDPFVFDRAFLDSLPPGSRGLRLAGADEVGRGSLAGPLVAAAVVLDYSKGSLLGLAGLTDSKLLTPLSRERMYAEILSCATRISWTAVSPGTIDRLGLHRCNISGLCSVLEACAKEYSWAAVDGFDLGRPDLRATRIVRGDYKSAAVAAASVVAKVVRDRLMRRIAFLHPEYGFECHVGYGTEHHMKALSLHGPCEVHRRSFRGVGNPQLELWASGALEGGPD